MQIFMATSDNLQAIMSLDQQDGKGWRDDGPRIRTLYNMLYLLGDCGFFKAFI